MLTQKRVRELLDYAPGTGTFYWRPGCHNRVRPGMVAGGLNAGGYWLIKIDGKKYPASRVAHLWMTGNWPVAEMDHINCIRDDDRWINLREATRAENNQNQRRDPRKALPKGVSAVRNYPNKFRARIRLSGKETFLGSFDTPQQAGEAYERAARAHRGRFARSG